ncbi:MAG: adenylate/guanylate cyclase domain-containing protein, partial [Acidimicrobiia bacterium]
MPSDSADRLPVGTVTFVLTDIEGSTRLWERDEAAMRRAMALHDDVLDQAAERAGGWVVRPRGEGDSRFLVFADALGAVTAAAAIERDLEAAVWPTATEIRVRIGVHTGVAQLRGGDYYGPAVNRCARLRSIGHGGQVLLSQASYELVRDSLPPGLGAVDLGEHVLRDLSRPEHVHQLVIDGLRTAFPALSSLSVIPNNLPVQTTDLIGRQSELFELRDLLGMHRLITILAPGGTGKTRLAIQLAADLAHAFSDGAYFAPLAQITDSGDIPQAIADAVGIQLAGDAPPFEQLLSFFRNKKQLVVLDNFEHVIQGTDLVSRILATAPEVRLVVTSRIRLNTTDEAVFALGGLDAEIIDGRPDPGSDAAQLFLETARRRNPGFVFTDSNMPALADILDMTEGLPLAIVLAASWADVLAIDEIASELRRSADFLESELLDLPERQRSVRAVFDSSWNMLDSSEQGLFARLSVFRGGFTRAAAEAVAGANLRQLSRLTGQSLLVVDQARSRFAIHELLRQYGEEHLRALGAAEETHTSFVVYFDGLMKEMASTIESGRRRIEVLHEIEPDIENLRSALRSGAGKGHLHRHAVIALWFYYEWKSSHLPAVELFTEAAKRFDEGATPEDHFLGDLSRSAVAWFLGLLGRTEEALAVGGPARDAVAESGTGRDLCFATNALNISLAYTGQGDRLGEECRQAIARADPLADRWWVAMLEVWAGFAQLQAGRFDEVYDFLTSVRPVFEELDDSWGLIWVHETLAIVARAKGDLATARAEYDKQLAAARSIGNLRSVQYALNQLGGVSLELGDTAGAVAYIVEGLRLSGELGQIQEILGALTDLAEVYLAAESPEESAALLAGVLDHPDRGGRRRHDQVSTE